MDSAQIQELRESINQRRSEALAVLANEAVSKLRLRLFLEHECGLCEIEACRYSYESMIEHASLQIDGMHKDMVQALDLAVEIAQLSGQFPEWAEQDLRLLDRPFLRMRWSDLKPFMFKLDQQYDFWLDLSDPDWSDFPEFDMTI
jgi:hypothetical protein